jgi:hypothetical protein
VTFKGTLAGTSELLAGNGSGLIREPPRLFARIGGTETVQLDAKPSSLSGNGPFGGGIFWGASADGSKAIFSAPGRLTSNSHAAGQLYRYDTKARSLTNLTPGSIAPELQGVVGASEDETHIYFVAHGALTEEAENAAGEKAKAGADNLYLYQEGKGIRFIGILSVHDEGAWSSAPSTLSARVSPDGNQLAFTSTEAEKLTATNGPESGYDNLLAQGGGCELTGDNTLVGDPHCAEAFLYDAEANQLRCISCNPSGARPAGPARLPTWSNPFEGPRSLSEQGWRLFFESLDVLDPGDRNKKRDVYEFEAAGTGTCNDELSTFDPATDGCLSLISGGRSSDESYLLDVSSDGRDAFFATREALLPGRDANENYDVYDAREGGGFVEPLAPPTCEAEGCKPPPSTPPPPPAPATPSFQGSGNPKPKKPKPKHHGKRHHKQKRSHHRQGAGR